MQQAQQYHAGVCSVSVLNEDMSLPQSLSLSNVSLETHTVNSAHVPITVNGKGLCACAAELGGASSQLIKQQRDIMASLSAPVKKLQ